MERKPRSALARSIAIGWAALSLLLTLWCSMELSGMGFPDGYITPYDRSTMGPLTILAVACGVQGLCFLLVGAMSRRVRALSLALGILAAAAVIVAPMIVIPLCPDLPACRSAYERITGVQVDDGEGG
jgi:peptidoglycan/LPS O-acetylase OafA/YrhL